MCVRLEVRAMLFGELRKNANTAAWTPPFDGHDGMDASGHVQAGCRSVATERSESWPVRIAPSEGLAAESRERIVDDWRLNREWT